MKSNSKGNATTKTTNISASLSSSNPSNSIPGEDKEKETNPKLSKLIHDLKNHSISALAPKYNKQTLLSLIQLSKLSTPNRTTKADLLQHLLENLLQKNKTSPIEKKITQPPTNRCPNPNCIMKTAPTKAHKCPRCNKFIHVICGLETDDVHFVICPKKPQI